METIIEELFGFLNAIHPQPPALLARLKEIVEHRFIPKKEFVLKAGEVNNKIMFIRSGLLWCYYEKEGKEVPTWFMKERDVVVSIDSFYKQVKSYENIQAWEDTEVFLIYHDQLQELYDTYPEFDRVGRILTTKYLIDWAEQLRSIRMLSSQERYDYFRQNKGDLMQRIPLKMIAPFLDIDPSTISRIRSKL